MLFQSPLGSLGFRNFPQFDDVAGTEAPTSGRLLRRSYDPLVGAKIPTL